MAPTVDSVSAGGAGRKVGAFLLSALALGSHLAFVAIAAARAFSMGVYCADDSVYAVIAKNLANGVGYATTIQHDTHEFVVRLFDPYMGTGPTVVLPAALLMSAVGNALWAPGATVVALWASLLWAIYAVLRRHSKTPERRHLAVLTFSCLAFGLTPWHFEHWSALLGEVPASLLVVLAIALWATRPTPHRFFAAGLVLSLAVLAKTLAALYALAFAVAAVADAARNANQPDGRLRRGLPAAAAGFAVPLTAMELWKLAALGRGLYVARVVETFQFLGTQGLGAPEPVFVRVTRICHDFYDRFSASAIEVSIFTAAAAFALFLQRDGVFRRFALATAIGLAAHVVYWLFFSVGWPRYMIMALVVASTLIALSMLVWPRRWLVVWVLAVAVWLVPTWGRVSFPSASMDRGWFRETTATVNLRRTADYLSRNARGRIVAGEWWATMMDLEYASSARLTFMGYRALPVLAAQSSFLLVDNGRFATNRDVQFLSLTTACGSPVLEAPPYRVFECPGAASGRSPGP